MPMNEHQRAARRVPAIMERLEQAITNNDQIEAYSVGVEILRGRYMIVPPPPPPLPGEKPRLIPIRYASKCKSCHQYFDDGELGVHLKGLGVWHASPCWAEYAKRHDLPIVMSLVDDAVPPDTEAAPVSAPVSPTPSRPYRRHRVSRKLTLKLLKQVAPDAQVVGKEEFARILTLPNVQAFVAHHQMPPEALKSAFYEWRRKERKRLGLPWYNAKATGATEETEGVELSITAPAEVAPVVEVAPVSDPPTTPRAWWKFWTW